MQVNLTPILLYVLKYYKTSFNKSLLLRQKIFNNTSLLTELNLTSIKTNNTTNSTLLESLLQNNPSSYQVNFHLYVFLLFLLVAFAILVYFLYKRYSYLIEKDPIRRFVKYLHSLGKKYYESNREFIRKLSGKLREKLWKKNIEIEQKIFRALLLFTILPLVKLANSYKIKLIEIPPYLCSQNKSIVNFLFPKNVSEKILVDYPNLTMVFVAGPFLFNAPTEVKGYPLLKAYVGIYNFTTNRCENYSWRTLIAYDYKNDTILIGDLEFFQYNNLSLLQQYIKPKLADVGNLFNLLKKISLPEWLVNKLLAALNFFALPVIGFYYLGKTLWKIFFFRDRLIKSRKVKVEGNIWGKLLYEKTGNVEFLERKVSFFTFLITYLKELFRKVRK